MPAHDIGPFRCSRGLEHGADLETTASSDLPGEPAPATALVCILPARTIVKCCFRHASRTSKVRVLTGEQYSRQRTKPDPESRLIATSTDSRELEDRGGRDAPPSGASRLSIKGCLNPTIPCSFLLHHPQPLRDEPVLTTMQYLPSSFDKVLSRLQQKNNDQIPHFDKATNGSQSTLFDDLPESEKQQALYKLQQLASEQPASKTTKPRRRGFNWKVFAMVFSLISLATLAIVATVYAVDKDVDPSLVAKLRMANTNLDRMKLLPNNDDWLFDFTKQDKYTFTPGGVVNANAATFPRNSRTRDDHGHAQPRTMLHAATPPPPSGHQLRGRRLWHNPDHHDQRERRSDHHRDPHTRQDDNLPTSIRPHHDEHGLRERSTCFSPQQ